MTQVGKHRRDGQHGRGDEHPNEHVHGGNHQNGAVSGSGGRDLPGTEYNGRWTAVSARWFPPLLQVQECSGRGLVQPVDQLIDNGVQAKPMQQLVQRPFE